MKVETVMTKDVLVVERATPLREVARLLAEHTISGLPVVEDGQVVGVVSEADILAKERGAPEKRPRMVAVLLDGRLYDDTRLEATTAGDAMSAPAVTIGPRADVSQAAARMLDGHVNRLPVVARDGTLLGIVTRADLVRAFVRSDAEIAREVKQDVVLRLLWISPDAVEVAVEDGVVHLTGTVENRETALMLPRFTQRVPGVVSVVSEIAYEDDKGRRQLAPAGKSV
jgi:CBS domain-containing protein